MPVNTGDNERALELATPDVALVGPRGTNRGREVLRTWLGHAGATFVTRAIHAVGESVVVAQRGIWRDTATGAIVGEADVGPHMEAIRIVLLGVFAAITYGIVHDEVTARICVEYFTIGHPPIIPTTSPTLLALAWGIVATWWVGLPLGLLLAVAARAGSRPMLSAAELRRPIAILLAVMATSALISGIVAGILAARGAIWLAAPFDRSIPADRQVPFLIDLWAHSASYLVGIVGGLVLVTWTWRSRARTLAVDALPNDSSASLTAAPLP